MKIRILLTTLLCAIFFTANSQITTVGIIGTATPGAWDYDTDMIQDTGNPDLWTLDITLTEGEAKFRANDDWPINWGSLDFPSGTGEQDGDNIPIPGGDFEITFNSATGEYSFVDISPIGIIGDATPGGWAEDTNMYRDTVEHGYVKVISLSEGSAKFRKDDDWVVNWGSSAFPSGIGVQDGDNIPVSPAGKYRVTLDTMTGAYNFTIVEFDTVSIIGDATPGGWVTDTDLTKDPGNADLWKGTVTLTDGALKFRVNHDWAINWGGTDWPSGTGVQDGPDIPAEAGEYQLTFNSATGEYSFLIIEFYNTIGIIGDATPGGWDTDTDMERDEIDSAIWTLRIILTDGELKFRAEDDWLVNWGSGNFPSGIGVQDGANVPIPAGEYKITFNTITGEYNFEEIIVYSTVGIIGPATPNANWDVDVDLEVDPGNEYLFALNSITLTDGEAKFRAEDAWTVNWGATDWPTGIGTQDGPNIPITGGTYSVSIITDTGEYMFADPVSTREEVLSPAVVKVFPNPTNDWLNIDVSNINLTGEVNVSVLDIQGRTISSKVMNASALMQLNVAGLPAGNYALQIRNTEYLIGKRFSIIK